ncbi:hypothetical protein TrCOL_g6323 [Triparma columacea]|uniref:Uncharacterized protein n=1 Tax=Triparma columacea TaxID=722753 RepID=A0A9W7LFV0_9STRA|nr:hypothetical protein TrCOL_g6323 [Triparma columacea]
MQRSRPPAPKSRLLPISDGGAAMLNAERAGAEYALRTGTYVVFRNVEKELTKRSVLPDCFRLSYDSPCFCGCTLADHLEIGGRCKSCRSCRLYKFVYTRPEEIGDGHLVRRRGFNVTKWRYRCECGHTHLDHRGPTGPCKECGCGGFRGFGLCVSCDGAYKDHEVVVETEEDRRREGRPVGEAYIPLSEAPGLQERVFGREGGGGGDKDPESMLSRGEISASEYMDLIRTIEAGSMDVGGGRVGMKVKRSGGMMRRNDKGEERMVRLMHESSGGTGKGRVVNKYGKFEKA